MSPTPTLTHQKVLEDPITTSKEPASFKISV